MTVAPARPWRRAAGWLLLLGPFFFLSYGAATWVTTLREHVGSVVFAWEQQIPFVPWTIIPYWSIDVLYGISLFLCTTERELGAHARRLLTAQMVAVFCFILAPLRFTFVRPPVDGVAGALFDALSRFDKPFNQAPSLHIALLVILWDRFARHTSRQARWILHGWFALIGLSVLTTWQHHFFDLPTGALLGFACLWAWPECAPSPLATAHLTRDRRRWFLAGFYAAGSAALVAFAAMASGVWLWLLWPAVSLGLVAGNYALFGAAGFQKAADGQMSLAARFLLAPYIAAAWINSRLWTRAEPAWVSIGDGVLLGRIPSRGTMTAWATTLDLCAELPRRARRGSVPRGADARPGRAGAGATATGGGNDRAAPRRRSAAGVLRAGLRAERRGRRGVAAVDRACFRHQRGDTACPACPPAHRLEWRDQRCHRRRCGYRPMREAAPDARQVLEIVSVVLGQGERVDHVSRSLTVASLAGMVAVGMLAARLPLPAMLLLGAASWPGWPRSISPRVSGSTRRCFSAWPPARMIRTGRCSMRR